MLNTAANPVHVAVGVIRNTRHQILIAKRADHLHQGGLWEFPGGKVEAGETVRECLQRELQEELGITIHQASPFIKIHHDYPDKSVLLDVWQVESFTGIPKGLQNQPLVWSDVAQLSGYAIPEANRPIVTALKLSRQMLVTGNWKNLDEFEKNLCSALQKGITLVQLRAHQCRAGEYLSLYALAKKRCDEYKALLITNTSIELFHRLDAVALHLTSSALMQCKQRPVSPGVLLGASCHSTEEIIQANKITVDYITLGPVYKTLSHPGSQALGIEAFSKLSRQSTSLVFALGGMEPTMLKEIIDAGAYGIAGISCYWNSQG